VNSNECLQVFRNCFNNHEKLVKYVLMVYEKNNMEYNRYAGKDNAQVGLKANYSKYDFVKMGSDSYTK